MSTTRAPDWFDPRGMEAWAAGIHAATGRRVEIVLEDGRVLLSVGAGEGEATSHTLEVNGQPAGRLELRPAITNEQVLAQISKAVETFQALAELRNSMADMVRTTAHQWRELSVLYRSSSLLRVDQAEDGLASHLLQQAIRALRCPAGLVRFGADEATRTSVAVGDDASDLEQLADWGATLDEGLIGAGADAIRRSGFSGSCPDRPLLIVPLRCRDRRFGSMVLCGHEKRRLSAEDLKLAGLLADQAGRAFDNLQLVERVRDTERLKRELELAAEIQSSILPPADIRTDWLEFAGACVPAKWVGGDAILFDEQRPDLVLAGVADVCGHGVSSALLMNAFASSISALSMAHAQPGRLLEIANDLLSDRVGVTGLFVTAVLLRLRENGELTVASAGHPEALIVRPSGRVEAIDCGGLPLGIMSGSAYPETRLKIEVGATVVAFSDGVTESKGPDGEMYGTDRLISLLEKTVPGAPTCDRVRAAILDDVAAFRAGCEQDDDVTVVVLRRMQ